MSTAILLSGGMDSVALTYWKRPTFAYTVDYGQLPSVGEIRAATAVTEALGIPHRILTAKCQETGSGDLAGSSPLACAPVSEWWPFRNQLLITVAGAAALKDGARELMFGAVSTDGIHVDGRREFFDGISKLMELQEGGLRITAPAVDLSPALLIQKSGVPLSILAWSHSCHIAAYACGTCRGCVKHATTMKELGYEDY